MNPNENPTASIDVSTPPATQEQPNPQPSSKPQDISQPQLDPGTDSSVDIPAVDPSDALGDDLLNDHDAEANIYSQGQLKVQITHTHMADSDVGDVIEPLAKGVAAGVGSLGNSLANLLDYGFTEANLKMAETVTGKSREDLLGEEGALQHFAYHAEHRELPDFLKPDDDFENLVSGITQFSTAFTGLGEVANLGQVGEIVGGLGTAAQKLPGIAKLLQGAEGLAEEFPAISKLASQALDGLKLTGKTATVDFAAFDGQQGNLANAISDLTKDKPGLAHTIADYLAVHKEDNELTARTKNTIVGQFGEAVGFAVFSSVKLLRTMHHLGNELRKEGGAALSVINEGFSTIKTDSEAFLNDLEKIKGASTDDILNHLKNDATPPSPTADASKLQASVSMNEDGSVNAEVFQHDPQVTSKGKVEVISPEDDAEKAVDRINNTYQSDTKTARMAQKEKAIEEMLKEQSKQSKSKFNKTAFVNNLQAKLKAGEPVIMQDELAAALGTQDLKHIDAYLQSWNEVVEATTSTIKRYVSNAEQKTKLEKVLAVGLGHDTKYDSALTSSFGKLIDQGKKSLTAVEDAALDRLGLNLLHEHVLGPELGKLYLAHDTALKLGNYSLAEKVTAAINEKLPMWSQARTLDKAILSEFARGLQTGKIVQTAEEAAAFGKAVEAAKKDYPLLTDMDLASEKARKVLGAMASDLSNNNHFGQVGGYAKFGKHFNMAMNAVNTAMKNGGKFSVGLVQELFYNNVLNSFETVKSIAFSNVGIKAYEMAADGIGATVHAGDTWAASGFKHADLEPMLKVKDEAEGFIRYVGEGFMGGLSVLKPGSKHPLDYVPSHPRVVSSEGFRASFGKSVGDKLTDMGFPKQGTYADWLIDKTSGIGGVVMWPMTHLIGGVDTSFKVANQRAVLWSEMKAHGRFQGLSDIDARQFTAQNIDKVTEDLIIARSHNFSKNTPLKNGVYTLDQLKDIHGKLSSSTDKVAMSQPLRNSAQSDRWVFKFFSKVDDASRMLGPIGTWEMPFIKTFANAVQYGYDTIPGVNMLSPHNAAIMRGEMGVQAKNNLMGKTILGSVLALGGIGAANNGLLATPQGSQGAKRNQKQLTGQDGYSIRFPNGSHNSVTLNFGKTTPIADAFFLPGRLWQLAGDAIDGKIDPGAATVAAASVGLEAFSSGRFLRGVSVSLDSFLNPSYSTAENFQRNIITGGLGSVLTPGGRLGTNLTRFTDPYYRDFSNGAGFGNDLSSYISSSSPVAYGAIQASTSNSPVYDMFGNPRPKDDYIGTTNTLATNLVRLLTPIGMKYTSNDKLSNELDRFGRLGQALTPANKNQQYKGYVIPLDQFKDSKTGETLWDAYNRELRCIAIPKDDGSGKMINLRNYLDDLTQSDDYINHMNDNSISRGTGKRQVLLGSRWGEIHKAYQTAKEMLSNSKNGVIWNKPEYQQNYLNSKGESLEMVIQKMDNEKTKLEPQ